MGRLSQTWLRRPQIESRRRTSLRNRTYGAEGQVQYIRANNSASQIGFVPNTFTRTPCPQLVASRATKEATCWHPRWLLWEPGVSLVKISALQRHVWLSNRINNPVLTVNYVLLYTTCFHRSWCCSSLIPRLEQSKCSVVVDRSTRKNKVPCKAMPDVYEAATLVSRDRLHSGGYISFHTSLKIRVYDPFSDS